jgi:5,10-methylenetetrahydromethanopterin reductase
LWMAEHLGYREAITNCAAFALQAPGPMLVPTAVSPYLWHATPTAMALATLDELAPGKVAVALGVGNPLFLQESGQKLEKPIRAMREFIEAMRKLWSTEPAHMDGEFVRLAGARMAFKANPIPIYIAAIGPDMLKLTGRIADGVVLSAALSTQSVKASLALCAEGAAKQGRNISGFRRAGYIFFGTSRNAREAIDAARLKVAFVMRNKFLAQNIKDSGIPIDQEAVVAAVARRDLATAASLVPDDAVEAFSIAGSPEHCLRRLRDFVEAGLDEPVLSLVGTPENCAFAIDVMRRF